MKRADLLVPIDRNPLEIYLLGLCVLSGMASTYGLIKGVPPADGAPVPAAYMFSVLLVLGGLCGIAGAFWPDVITGVLIVRTAMIPTAAGTMAYALMLLAHPATAGSALAVGGFAIACGWRAWTISKHIRDLPSTHAIVDASGVVNTTTVVDAAGHVEEPGGELQ